jgi:ParB family chromosome partitioning protein
VQRANFNPIEEADGLRAMLELHDGNQAAAARAMGKSKGWFNQRIGLLRLTDEMVQLVLEGKLTALRDMRRYAAMPPGEQHAAWKSDQEKPPPPSKEQPPLAAVPDPPAYTAVHTPDGPARTEATPVEPAGSSDWEAGPADYHGVIIPEAATGTPPTTSVPEPTEQSSSSAPPEQPERPVASAPVPEPRTQQATGPTESASETLPYDDPTFISMHLETKMTVDDFAETTAQMAARCWDKAGLESSFAILRGMLDAASDRDPETLLPVLQALLASYPEDQRA